MSNKVLIPFDLPDNVDKNRIRIDYVENYIVHPVDYEFITRPTENQIDDIFKKSTKGKMSIDDTAYELVNNVLDHLFLFKKKK